MHRGTNTSSITPSPTIKVVFYLPPQRLQPRLGAAAELFRIAFRYDRTNAVFNQGLLVLENVFDPLLLLGFDDDINADI